MKIDFSKKDSLSYVHHDRDHLKVDPATYRKFYKDTNVYQQFDLYGYRAIIEANPHVRSLHIDLGCGGGWMLEKTAPYFKKVIGVDPSKAAIDGAYEVTKNLTNVELMQADMVEALVKISPTEPVLLTTTTVLSHINDLWVSEFLKAANELPKGSILAFGEPHGRNIQRELWYIRDPEWWSARLPNWQLVFNDHAPFGYNYGLVGVNWGEKYVLNRHRKNLLQKISWQRSFVYHKVRNFFADLIKQKA